MSWADKINTLVESGKHDTNSLAKAIKIDLFGDIVENTRVDTGRLKGNWQIQNNKFSPRELKAKDKTPKGTMSPSTQNKILQGSLPNSVTYFTNNLPYAKKYEEIDGMVVNAVNRVKANLDAMVKEL